MKIIHCSDLHLDSKMSSNLDSKKAKERRDEILITFQNMVKYAIENDVKVIMVAGDLFDKSNITKKAKNIVLDSIISNSNIDFLILKGNHDEGVLFTELEKLPQNLKLFNNKNWTQYRYNNITISGIEFGNLNSYEIYNTLIIDKNKINIVLMHGQESKYEQKDKTEIINMQELKNKNIDYLALGHIHKYKREKIDNRGIYCYSGCLEGRGFDECGEKGFVLLQVDEDNKKIESNFISFASRCLYEINVDVTGLVSTLEIEKKVDEEIKNIASRNLIKIVLKGNLDLEVDIDINYLEKKYNSVYYFAKIYDETKLKIDYMSYEKDQSLKGEFIRLILSQNLDEKTQKELITTGIKALSGEEVD